MFDLEASRCSKESGRGTLIQTTRTVVKSLPSSAGHLCTRHDGDELRGVVHCRPPMRGEFENAPRRNRHSALPVAEFRADEIYLSSPLLLFFSISSNGSKVL